ncbi:MAG TPA: phage holin family protein [Pseudolabrys sp.]|nr:phage holin family protein [Pseudolabrys sp.]
MRFEPIIRNLRVLWRADAILAEIRIRHLLFRFGLGAFAALIALFGLLMLELAAYFALVQYSTAVAAAAILGVLNFLVAGTVLLVGSWRKPGHEHELAMEVHASAIEALSADGDRLGAEVKSIINSLKHPLDGALLGLLAPLLTALIRSLRRPAGDKP